MIFMKKITTRLLSLVLLGAFIPSFVLAAEWDLKDGSITVNAAPDTAQTVTQGSGAPTIDDNPVITSSGTTSNTVSITAAENATANVTLENVNIDTGTRGGAAITTSGEGNVNIELDGTNTVQSGNDHAGVEKKGDGTLTITDEDKDGSLTATGGNYGAGIGGGHGSSGSNIAIEGGKVEAISGGGGAGIGGGLRSNGSGVTISSDAQVKAQGGAEYMGFKEGAAIGNGGTDTQEGDELILDTSKLTVDGFIQKYGPQEDINNDPVGEPIVGTSGEHSWDKGTVTTQPTCTTAGVMTYTCKNPAHNKKTEPIPALNHNFKTYIYDNNATCTQDGTETAKCERCDATDTRTAKGTKLEATTPQNTQVPNQQSPYWVTGPEGQSLTYQAQQKDGVLTVTVQADTASLRGTTGSLRQLEAQGITGIRFVTNRAQSDFTLSDLLTSGTGSFTLTHDGDKVTFTLESTDISGILK